MHFQSIFQILPVNGYSTATGGARNFIFSKIILVSQQLYKMLLAPFLITQMQDSLIFNYTKCDGDVPGA